MLLGYKYIYYQVTVRIEKFIKILLNIIIIWILWILWIMKEEGL